MRIDGVDISHYQDHPINYKSLMAAGVKWMYHKATEGTTVIDKNYDRRRAEAKAAGLTFGAYHFARPTGNDAREEARFFIAKAKPVPGDLRPCLDLETNLHVSGRALARWADEFVDEVEKLVGVTPVIYTPYILGQELEKKATFWVPRYNNDNRPPSRPWDIHQFSDGILGRPNAVPGIGNCDLNHSKVGVDELTIPIKMRGRGRRIDSALKSLRRAESVAKDGSHRETAIQKARRVLRTIKRT